MLNRRNALIAASGLAAAGTSQLLNISAANAAQRPETADDATSPIKTLTEVAQSCLKCASECDRILESNTADAGLRRLATDCRDICTVTATLLARQTSISPAICQACQDSCERLAAANTAANSAALKCANACRNLLEAQTQDSPAVLVLTN